MKQIIEKAVKWVKCLFGFHDWVYCSQKPTNGTWNRECRNCEKRMHGIYDMSYGDTNWYDGWEF